MVTWVTADQRRIPVRVKSAVVIGSFTGELISAQGLTEVAKSDGTSLVEAAALPNAAEPAAESDI